MRWFARDFVSAESVDGELAYADFCMDESPVYAFRHGIAADDGTEWQPIASRRPPVDIDSRQLDRVWYGIWRGRD